jgi:hypothetical protein
MPAYSVPAGERPGSHAANAIKISMEIIDLQHAFPICSKSLMAIWLNKIESY